MNVLDYYLDTSIRGNVRQRCSYQFKIDSLYCSHVNYIERETEDDLVPSIHPLLSLAYDGGTCVASANEAGFVQLCDIFNLKSKMQYELHQNAIFDIKWRPNQPDQLLTASGDLSIALVDIYNPEKKIAHITDSHTSSVRNIDFQDTNVFASGARDGHIKIWDLRDSTKPKFDIPFAHDVNAKTTKRHSKRRKSLPTNVVTAVLFNDYQLYSGGASDGTIKVWDTRSKAIFKRQPVKQIPYDGCSSFSDKQGYTSFHMSQGLLYASCSDKIVYCYSSQLDRMIGRYKGARINNYTRLTILQDEFLICGSMNRCACIWKLCGKPQEKGEVFLPCYTLPEDSEVSSVEVVSKMGFIYTGTDEGRLRKWTFEPPLKSQRVEDEEKSYEKVEIYKEPSIQETSLNESEIENIPNNNSSIQDTSSDNFNDSLIRNTPRPTRRIKSRKQRKRKSPRSFSPKARKSAKTRHQPTEPLTPITNYYQKLPKKDDPKG